VKRGALLSGFDTLEPAKSCFRSVLLDSVDASRAARWR
jgi:hypothetical protein